MKFRRGSGDEARRAIELAEERRVRRVRFRQELGDDERFREVHRMIDQLPTHDIYAAILLRLERIEQVLARDKDE